jgi:predicted RNA-binding protein with PUA-like domain
MKLDVRAIMSKTNNYFLGVANNNNWLALKEGDTSYWCMYRNSNASPGDLIALYRTGRGISQLFKVIDDPAQQQEFQCKMRDMLTVPIELLVNAVQPVTIKEMKEDPILSKCGAVARNFQATVFTIDKEIWDALVRLLSKKNSTIIGQLRKYER